MKSENRALFLKLRKQYISDYYKTLNNKQLEAVLKTEGPLLLLAGAGSGKTTVLIQRVSNILRFGSGSDSDVIPAFIRDEDVTFLQTAVELGEKSERTDALCGVDVPYPSNVLAITFTNKAANELKARLLNDIGPESSGVWAMTFHSACCRILRKEIDRLGYSTNFTIYDATDSEKVMKDILKDKNLDEKTFPPKLMLSYISRAKEQLLDALAFKETLGGHGDYRKEVAADCYIEYQAQLRSANALDFDDIIFLTVLLLQQYPEVRDYYARKFRYILVDEYQDTNHAQYVLTSMLASGYRNICVVGDDDQSIYKFRGATIANILEFEEHYKGTVTIRLEQNYRSTKKILEAANAVISHNRGRKGKVLWTDNHEGDAVIVHECPNEFQESEYVAGQILKKARSEGYSGCAILYRTNVQSNVIERTLAANAIPYRIFGGTRFFDRAEIKDILAYLMVINNPADELRLNRIINNPPRGIGAKSLETAKRLAESMGLPLFEVISNAAMYPALEKSANKFLAFCEMIKYLRACSGNMELPDFYDAVLEQTGYVKMLDEKDLIEYRSKAENVRELRSNFVQFCESTDVPTLSAFLEEISLYTDLEKYNEDDQAVTLMTIHSAKGLEFDYVFLVGLEDGLFPSARSMDDTDDLEEERRLCYVAITRAKKELVITYANQRMLYGRTTPALASRFLRELPDNCKLEHRRRAVGTASVQSGFSEYDLGFEGYQVPEYGQNKYRVKATPAEKKKTPFSSANQKTSTTVSFQPGNMVEHRSFGKGMVLTAMKIGNDCLLEIAFDKFGTKKLMANSASAHMIKL